jgi:hypothetical protein
MQKGNRLLLIYVIKNIAILIYSYIDNSMLV